MKKTTEQLLKWPLGKLTGDEQHPVWAKTLLEAEGVKVHLRRKGIFSFENEHMARQNSWSKKLKS